MGNPLTARQFAEGVEQFADDLLALMKRLDDLCSGAPSVLVDRVNGIEHQDQLDTVARAFQALGDRLSRECDHAEEAEDRDRDSPLHPQHRRLGQ